MISRIVAIARASGSLSQLEELQLGNLFNFGSNDCVALGSLLETGVWKLKKLCISRSNIGDDGVAALTNGLASIGSSLKELHLAHNSIGNGGLLALVSALETCISLEILDLSRNVFSLAFAGMHSLSNLLQRDQMKLKWLHLSSCAINDEGLQALAPGAANHCENLVIHFNAFTASGLECFSTSLQSECCRVETLHLSPIGSDGIILLARRLLGNTSLKRLDLLDNDTTITSAGWSAISTALCDTTSVNSTYLSNHTLCDIRLPSGIFGRDVPDHDIVLFLRMNKEHPQYAARCKILKCHPHLDMVPFFQWKLKFLPLAVDWFKRARPCTTLSIYETLSYYDNNNPESRRILEESYQAFQSRVLTAVYEFVHGMPMEVMKRRDMLALVAAYDDEIARLREQLEQGERKITQLEKEKNKLSGIVDAVRNRVGV